MTSQQPPGIPPTRPAQEQLVNRDDEHLNLLSILHYVLAGISALFSCFPIIHVAMGILFVVAPPSSKGGGPPPQAFGWIFIIIGSSIILFGWTLAALIFFAGRSLSQRRRYMFCFVIACVMLLSFPFGTALGVFTIIVLQRPSVKDLFATASALESGASPNQP
jgi:hypothetical protein